MNGQHKQEIDTYYDLLLTSYLFCIFKQNGLLELLLLDERSEETLE